jgi:hypothetical protein
MTTIFWTLLGAGLAVFLFFAGIALLVYVVEMTDKK